MPPLRGARIRRARDRHHHREVATEVHRQPAVPVNRLPVTRTPRMVAQAQAVDRELRAVDLDRAASDHVLFVVPARERFFGFLLDLRTIRVDRFAAEHRRCAFVVEVDLGRDHRVVLERIRRVRHLLRVLHQTQLAAIAHRQAFERLDDVERHAGAAERVVRFAFGPREHEADAAVRQIDTTRHLAAAFVRSIRQPKPAADPTGAVEHVEVHALVEVLRRFDRVRVLVLRIQTHPHPFGCRHDPPPGNI